MNYKFVRRVTFAFYLMFAVVFCSLLVYWGRGEVGRLQHYSKADLKYVDTVLTCQNNMSSVERSYTRLLLYRTESNATLFCGMVADLNASVKDLVALEKGKIIKSELVNDELLRSSTLVLSSSLALSDSFMSRDLDRAILFNEASKVIGGELAKVRYQLEKKVVDELNLSKKRQDEVKFFSQKMLKLFVIFFVLTISFSVSSSFILSKMLQKGLRKLSFGAHEISGGNYEYCFDNVTNDNIGSVMNDFNYMAQQLRVKTSELVKANVELSNASKHKDRFLANMSHELRTPLNSVVGFSELLIERGADMDGEKIKRYGTRIFSASEHLLALISDLLDVVKVDAGVLLLNAEKFDLSVCMQQVCDMMQPVVEKNGLRFETSIQSELSIVADQKLIKQIVINLVNNAAKFTHEGSVALTVCSAAGGFELKVQDTGIGISDADQKRIFDDFHRVETGMTANYEGVGIGLTLTKRLVELHGGTISLESTLNKGSVFTVYLPKGCEKNED